MEIPNVIPRSMFSQEDLEYLRGDRFSGGHRVSIRSRSHPYNQQTLLCKLSEGLQIVHVGAADAGFTADKIARGTWLHTKLVSSAKYVLGVDIDEAGVSVAQRHGYQMICADVLDLVGLDCFDAFLLPDILEHLDNPHNFLSRLRISHPSVEHAIITVPNAFSLQNFTSTIHETEFINSDHRSWWTPYTLAKIAVEAGWFPMWFTYCQRAPTQHKLWKRLVWKKYPHLNDTLVMWLSHAGEKQ